MTLSELLLLLYLSVRLAAAQDIWINEVNHDASGTRGYEIVCKSGALLGTVKDWMYNAAGTLTSSGTFFQDEDSVCPTSSTGVSQTSVGWNFANLDDGISICLWSSELGVVQFLGFGSDGSPAAGSGPCGGLVPTEVGLVDTDEPGSAVHLTGTGCDYDDFTWTYDLLGNVNRIPNNDQVFNCITPMPTTASSVAPSNAPTSAPSIGSSVSQGLQFLGSYTGATTQSCRGSQTVALDAPIWTDRLELLVTDYYRWPSMRIGVNDEQIGIASIVASSSNGLDCDGGLAALPAEHGCSSTCCSNLGWCGAEAQSGDRLVIELAEVTYVTSLVVQGIYGGAQWGSVRGFDLYGEAKSAAPSVSLRPSSSPTASPTSVSSIPPSVVQSLQPSAVLSIRPSASPSLDPTSWPSGMPSITPTVKSSLHPTTLPSVTPSLDPTTNPSFYPTILQSSTPSLYPTAKPSLDPTTLQSSAPSIHPTSFISGMPSIYATGKPSLGPTTLPSDTPSIYQTTKPSVDPTSLQSTTPSIYPTSDSSIGPSSTPSATPSSSPIAACPCRVWQLLCRLQNSDICRN